MKLIRKTIIAVTMLCLGSAFARAAVNVELDGGKLQTSTANVALPSGFLLQIIATRAGASGVFVAPTIGNYVGGDNLVVSSFAMNDSFTGSGSGETVNTIIFSLENTGPSSSATFDQGDAILLRWYPTITYAQFLTGTLPTANTPYGQYRSDTGMDSGIAWFTPADGTSLSVPFGLNFLTTAVGGSLSNSLGIANLTVIPEPSTYAMLIGGFGMLAGLKGMRRRRA